MKKVIFIILMFSVFTSSAAEWACVSDSDCSESMSCVQDICRMIAGKFSDYASVEIKIGEKSPSPGGSKNIFIPHPAKDMVLGQFEIYATQAGTDGKFFVFKEMEYLIALSNQNIKGDNLRLVYDKNGDGKLDDGDIVISQNDQSEIGDGVFSIDQKHATYPMNTPNYFLVLGDFEYEGEIEMLWPFGLEFVSPSEDFMIKNEGEVFITSHQKTAFARYVFEPEKDFFILASGEHFPTPPDWKNMNGKVDVMHLRAKSIDGSNKINSITVKTTGSSQKFGEGVGSIAFYTDENGDGKGDDLLAEKVFSQEEPVTVTVIEIPEGSLSFKAGEEKRMVVKAEIFLYNGQSVQLSINDNDVKLENQMKFAGLPVTTDIYKYICDETDPECNVIPEEDPEPEEDEGGCSVLFL